MLERKGQGRLWRHLEQLTYLLFLKMADEYSRPPYKRNSGLPIEIIDLIDKESWVRMGADVKGEIYEGLLEKNAEDTKSGAGQYFTPRTLIWAMVECIRPKPKKAIADPACGTGGFFLAAYDFLVKNYTLDKEQSQFLKDQTFRGNEIVQNTRLLALMNMFLHNIDDIIGESMISSQDALIAPSPESFDYVLANPPFGKKAA